MAMKGPHSLPYVLLVGFFFVMILNFYSGGKSSLGDKNTFLQKYYLIGASDEPRLVMSQKALYQYELQNIENYQYNFFQLYLLLSHQHSLSCSHRIFLPFFFSLLLFHTL